MTEKGARARDGQRPIQGGPASPPHLTRVNRPLRNFALAQPSLPCQNIQPNPCHADACRPLPEDWRKSAFLAVKPTNFHAALRQVHALLAPWVAPNLPFFFPNANRQPQLFLQTFGARSAIPVCIFPSENAKKKKAALRERAVRRTILNSSSPSHLHPCPESRSFSHAACCFAFSLNRAKSRGLTRIRMA